MLTWRSAGESHGPCITAILEGVPAGLRVDLAGVDRELARRQGGFGRGARMRIERDRVRVLGGLIGGRTTGAPLLLQVDNKDASLASKPALHRPRPGHADLPGVCKYLLREARPVLERASARETCIRVAAGAVVRQLLARFGIEVVGFVDSIEGVASRPVPLTSPAQVRRRRARNDLMVLDPTSYERMKQAIRDAAREGDTVGGTFRVLAFGVPPGLGSYSQWDRRLDGLLAQALMCIPAVKAVEIGLGFRAAGLRGSRVHDEIFHRRGKGRFGGVYRGSDRAGGLEGGVTNGEILDARVAMKPISTLRRPLRSIDLRTLRPSRAAFERSDVCAVPAASVVGEAMVALTLGAAFLDKFASDNLVELDHSVRAYRRELAERF